MPFLQRFLVRRRLVALVSGAVLAFALPTVFPFFGRSEILPGGALTVLAYVALVPFLIAIEGATTRWAWFGLGHLCGLGYFVVSVPWLYVTLHTFGGIPTAISWLIMLLFFNYLAVYWAFAFLVAFDLRKAFPNLPRWLVIPAAFTTFELARNYGVGGFPWANLGYTVARDRTFVQWASVFGVDGLAFLVVLINTGLADLWRNGLDPQGRKRAGVVVLIAFLFPRAYGLAHLSAIDAAAAAAPKIKVAVIQGNVDQKIKNAAKGGQLNAYTYRDFVLSRYLPLSRQADEQGVDLILWPEASFPGTLPMRPREFPDLLGQPFRVPLLIGGVTVGRREGDIVLTNSAFLVAPDRRVLAQYDKHHLVPFGEYIPLEKELHLPLRKVVPDIGFFDPGESLAPINVFGSRVPASFGAMICYDSIFPEIGVATTRQNPGFLVNVTNDAWYGISSAPYQFLSMVSVRAVETGRAFARAANTGISAFVDPAGRILKTLGIGLVDTDVADLTVDQAIPPAMLIDDVPQLTGTTVYVVIGNVFAYICALFALGGWIVAWWQRRRAKVKA